MFAGGLAMTARSRHLRFGRFIRFCAQATLPMLGSCALSVGSVADDELTRIEQVDEPQYVGITARRQGERQVVVEMQWTVRERVVTTVVRGTRFSATSGLTAALLAEVPKPKEVAPNFYWVSPGYLLVPFTAVMDVVTFAASAPFAILAYPFFGWDSTELGPIMERTETRPLRNKRIHLFGKGANGRDRHQDASTDNAGIAIIPEDFVDPLWIADVETNNRFYFH